MKSDDYKYIIDHMDEKIQYIKNNFGINLRNLNSLRNSPNARKNARKNC